MEGSSEVRAEESGRMGDDGQWQPRDRVMLRCRHGDRCQHLARQCCQFLHTAEEIKKAAERGPAPLTSNRDPRADVDVALHGEEKEYMQRVAAYLKSVGATSRTTAVVLAKLGNAVNKPQEIETKLWTLVSRTKGFHVERDELHALKQWVWYDEPIASGITSARSKAFGSIPKAPSDITLDEYLERLTTWFERKGIFSRDTAVLMTTVGEAVPKPETLLKLKPFMQDSGRFCIEQDPDSQPKQWVWLDSSKVHHARQPKAGCSSAIPERKYQGLGSAGHQHASAGQAHAKQTEKAYAERVRSWLSARGATSSATGVNLAQLGLENPKPPHLLKLKTFLEETGLVFVGEDPSMPKQEVVWLKGREAALTSSPERVQSEPRVNGNYAQAVICPRQVQGGSAAAVVASKRHAVPDSNPEAEAYITSIKELLRAAGADDRHSALDSGTLMLDMPKPPSLTQSLTELLKGRSEIHIETDPFEADLYRLWLSSDRAASSIVATTQSAAKYMMFKGPGVPSNGHTTTRAPATSTTSSNGPLHGVHPKERDEYLDRAKRWLEQRKCFSYETAVPLKDLGAAVPKPPTWTRLRPVLEACTWLRVQQDPDIKPVQVTREAMSFRDFSVEVEGAFSALCTHQWVWIEESAERAKGLQNGSRTSCSPHRRSTGLSASSPPRPTTATTAFPILPAQPAFQPLPLRLKDLFHPDPKREARYQEDMVTLRLDIDKLRHDGILDKSLQVGPEAKILTFLGEATLGANIVRALVDMYSGNFDEAGLRRMRLASTHPHNLAKLFDDLGIRKIMRDGCPCDLSAHEWRPKAEILQAVLGELDTKLRNGTSMSQSVRRTAEQLLARVAAAAVGHSMMLKPEDERRRLVGMAARLES